MFPKLQAEQLKKKTANSQNCQRTVCYETRTTNGKASSHSTCFDWVFSFLFLTDCTKLKTVFFIFLNLNRQINEKASFSFLFVFFSTWSLFWRSHLADVSFNLKGVLPVGVAYPSAPPRQLTCQNKTFDKMTVFPEICCWVTFSFFVGYCGIRSLSSETFWKRNLFIPRWRDGWARTFSVTGPIGARGYERKQSVSAVRMVWNWETNERRGEGHSGLIAIAMMLAGWQDLYCQFNKWINK